MRYEAIEAELVHEFPELAAAVQRFYDNGESGAYILFEDLFRVYVSELLAAVDSPPRRRKLEQVFRFVEAMLDSGGEVQNLAVISIFEGQSGNWLQYAKPYLGSRAEEALDRCDPEWRIRALRDCRELDTSEVNDLYGVRSIAESVCAAA